MSAPSPSGPVHEAWSPADERELAEMLRAASASARSVHPRGGHTHLGSVPPPREPGIELELAGLSGVVAYDPGDLTVVVRAGTSLAALSEVLQEHRHEVALDAEDPDRASLGGILACGVPTRATAAGRAARDQVLGSLVTQMDGTATRSGGRVVKNVTGYDLDKLWCGSRGSLAVLTEVALRVHPAPPDRRGIAVVFDDLRSSLSVAAELRDLGPQHLDVFDPEAARAALGIDLEAERWILLARWRGRSEVVRARCEGALDRARRENSVPLVDDEVDPRAVDALLDRPRTALGGLGGGCTLAFHLRPSRAVELEHALRASLDEALPELGSLLWCEREGSCWRVIFPTAPDAERLAHWLRSLRHSPFPSTAWTLALEHGSGAVHTACRPFLPAPAFPALQRRLKHAFDPAGLLAPGAHPALEEDPGP